MKERNKKILAMINYPRTFFVYLCVLSSSQKDLIKKDLKRWCDIHGETMGNFQAINWFMSYKKEFRNLIQYRLKRGSLIHFLVARMLWKPLETLYIYTKEIGGGFYIQHGFATIISAQKIGENCRVYQQVTIGYKGEDSPILEDNVSVTCGAKVLGDVTMHTGSLAAAGAVVVKDVPSNAIVAGVPAKVIGYKDENNLDFQG